MQRMLIAGVVAVLVLISGCAMSPAELRERGDKAVVNLKAPPRAAAACVARAMENTGSAIWGYPAPTIREGLAPDQTELVLGVNGASFMLVADFAPAPAGSTATLWLHSTFSDRHRRELLASFEGC